MKKILINLFNGGLFGLGFFLMGLLIFISVKARNGLQSSPGDKLTSATWNNFVNQFNALSGAFANQYKRCGPAINRSGIPKAVYNCDGSYNSASSAARQMSVKCGAGRTPTGAVQYYIVGGYIQGIGIAGDTLIFSQNNPPTNFDVAQVLCKKDFP